MNMFSFLFEAETPIHYYINLFLFINLSLIGFHIILWFWSQIKKGLVWVLTFQLKLVFLTLKPLVLSGILYFLYRYTLSTFSSSSSS